MSEDYPVHIEILPHVHLIRGANRAKFPEANALLIDDEVLTLVDAGPNKSRIEKTLTDLGHSIKDLQRIVLTHFHIDHKGYAAQLQDESGCEVLCHPLAEKGIRTFEGMVQDYGIKANRMYRDWISAITTWLPHVTGNYEVTGTFSEDKPIDCGETQLIPLHTPGHTPDHTCFGINDYETLLVVDIDLTRFGPWYGNVVSNIEQFESSIRRVMELSPRRCISSHLLNPVTEDVQGRLAEFLAAFGKRDQTILALVGSGVDTLDKLVSRPTIYPEFPHPIYYIFEEFMVKKHLDRLMRKNLIVKNQGRLRLVGPLRTTL
jgi:glyoxylase-like metal-dependent hydrolase (beta-lactamase superfamily II)